MLQDIIASWQSVLAGKDDAAGKPNSAYKFEDRHPEKSKHPTQVDGKIVCFDILNLMA